MINGNCQKWIMTYWAGVDKNLRGSVCNKQREINLCIYMSWFESSLPTFKHLRSHRFMISLSETLISLHIVQANLSLCWLRIMQQILWGTSLYNNYYSLWKYNILLTFKLVEISLILNGEKWLQRALETPVAASERKDIQTCVILLDIHIA